MVSSSDRRYTRRDTVLFLLCLGLSFFGLFSPASFGYIWLPGLVVIAVCSFLMAPVGAKAAHALPVGRLKRIFASILYALAAYMLWKGLSS